MFSKKFFSCPTQDHDSQALSLWISFPCMHFHLAIFFLHFHFHCYSSAPLVQKEGLGICKKKLFNKTTKTAVVKVTVL